MANIITDVSGDLNVRMTNARFARQPLPAVFSGWSKLRVALRLKIADSGLDITGTPRFGFGLCSGNTNILGDATTTHFVGALTNVATITRNVTSPVIYTTTNELFPAKRIGSTFTFGTTFASSPAMAVGVYSLWFLDITKGSPNYTLQMFFRISTAGTPTNADFLTQSVAGVPAFTAHLLQTAQTLAVDETTNGTLDHACVWWNQTTPVIDISEWRVYRLI
jgi:hypothetical protein